MTEWLIEILALFHVFLIVVWLGTDLVVFALSMSLLNRNLPIAVRLDRAHVAETIDRWVLISFLLTIPVGLALVYLRGWSLFDTPWLSLKLTLFGVIVVISIAMLTGAGGTTQTLKRIAAGSHEVAALEMHLRKRVLVMAPPVLAIYACILAIIFVSLHPERW